MGRTITGSLTTLRTRLKIVLILCVSLLVCSCRSKYLSLDYSIHHGGCISADSSCAVFALSRNARRSATGLARFPDGGIPDYLLEDVGIYLLDRESKTLSKIVDLSDNAVSAGTSRLSWKIHLDIRDSQVMYRAGALNEKNTSAHIYDLKTKESRPYREEREIQCPQNRKFGVSDIRKELSYFTPSEMGFVLDQIYPKPDEDYIDETIYLKNNSKLTRMAVVEQIISKKSSSEIAGLLQKMDDYQRGLEGIEKTEYGLYSKETYEAIEGIVEEWTDIFLDVSSFEDQPYPVANLFDADAGTFAHAEEFFLRLPATDTVTVHVFPGNGKSKEAFLKHSRPKEIEFTILGGVHADGFVTERAKVYKGLRFGEPIVFSLFDSFEVQSLEIELPQHELKKLLQRAKNRFRREFDLEARDACVALKGEVIKSYPGSEHNETCISEVFTGDVLVSEALSGEIKRVYLNDEENKLVIEKRGGVDKTLYSDTSSVLQIVEVSENKTWATVISMAAEAGGRVETDYLLFDLAGGEIMNELIGAQAGSSMYFGPQRAGLESLVYTAKDGSENKVYLK